MFGYKAYARVRRPLKLALPSVLSAPPAAGKCGWPGGSGILATSIVNNTTFGVIVDILFEKQYVYSPSMCAANVYLPDDSRSPR